MKRFLPADALWNLAMAINVYMTLFRNYNAQRLKTLEWRYHCMVCCSQGVVSSFATMFESCDKSWISITDPKVSISAMDVHSWLPSSTSSSRLHLKAEYTAPPRFGVGSRATGSLLGSHCAMVQHGQKCFMFSIFSLANGLSGAPS